MSNNWYKIAYEINNFTDRNHVNNRIKIFKDIAMNLNYLKDYVYQNAKDAQAQLLEIADSKEMSSYKDIQSSLTEAANRCLDNYDDASGLIASSLEQVYLQIKKLEADRYKFIHEVLPNKSKEK